MWAMGDKYDIPGLRVCSRDNLRKAYEDLEIESWTEVIKIFEFAYQQSQKHDELRSWLVEVICEGLKNLKIRGHFVDDVPGFYPFMEQSPELATSLLKDSVGYYRRPKQPIGSMQPYSAHSNSFSRF